MFRTLIDTWSNVSIICHFDCVILGIPVHNCRLNGVAVNMPYQHLKGSINTWRAVFFDLLACEGIKLSVPSFAQVLPLCILHSSFHNQDITKVSHVLHTAYFSCMQCDRLPSTCNCIHFITLLAVILKRYFVIFKRAFYFYNIILWFLPRRLE